MSQQEKKRILINIVLHWLAPAAVFGLIIGALGITGVLGLGARLVLVNGLVYKITGAVAMLLLIFVMPWLAKPIYNRWTKNDGKE